MATADAGHYASLLTMRFTFLAAACALAACSSSAGAGSGQSPESTGDGGASAAHAPFPKVVYQGGALVAAPKVVTVTFPGDPFAAQLAQFGESIVSSSWWDAVRGDFCDAKGSTCVGDGPPGTSVAITQSLAANYTDSAMGGASSLQPFIAGLVTSNAIPAPDANTVYVFYVPSSTTITLDGSKSCSAFDGYHNVAVVGGKHLYYAVVSECAPSEHVSALQYTTSTAAHEIIEAASDPDDPPGWYLDMGDPAAWGWNDVEGGEVADLCTDPFLLGQDLVAVGSFMAQRVWSPKNAAANKNPCVPIPSGEVYFNAAPTKSILALDVGQSATVEVDAFSDAPMDAWTLSAQDWTDPNTTYVKFAIAGGTQGSAGPQIQVNNGTKVQVTVTLVADPGASANGEADAVMVSTVGDPSSPTRANWWPLVVMTPAEAADAGVSGARRQPHPARPHKIVRKRRVR
jgi:hypothetical protein